MKPVADFEATHFGLQATNFRLFKICRKQNLTKKLTKN